MNSRYTLEKEIAIGRRYETGGYSREYVARRYGISPSTLDKCRRRYKESLVSGSTVKLCEGDRVKVLDARCISSSVYLNPSMEKHIGKEYTVKYIESNGRVHLKSGNMSGSWGWDVKWLEKVCKAIPQQPKVCGVVTKEEWLVALIGGAIGGQSGNVFQRWRYDKETSKFQSKCGAGWRSAEVNGLTPDSRTFSIINEVEMTIAEIEKALCVTNLKVVS